MSKQSPSGQNKDKGYGKRPLWQWILLYVIIGGLVYLLIYLFFIAGGDDGTGGGGIYNY